MICNEREKYNKETNECESICKKGKIYDFELDNCISICLKGENIMKKLIYSKRKISSFETLNFFKKIIF